MGYDEKNADSINKDNIEDNTEELALFFKVFADSTRLRILKTLLSGESCVSDIAEKLNMEQSAISHSLSFIKQMKLIKSKRVGKQMVYFLADDHISSIITMGLEHIGEED